MKGAQVTIDYLRIFCALADSGSFSRTAREKHLTQSAVSQQLACLERIFGKKLVERGTRFGLTPEGAILRNGARTIIRTYDDVHDKIRRRTQEPAGRLKIEASYSIGLYLLPPYLAGFLRKYPNIETDVEYKRADAVCADVHAGDCDIGVVVLPCFNRNLTEQIPFRKERLALVCSPRHPLAGRKQIKLQDLSGEKFSAFSKELRTRHIIDDLFKKRGVGVRVAHEFDNVEILKKCVEVGDTVSILPETTVRRERANKTLKCIPLMGPYYRRTGLILHKKRRSRAATEFVRFVGENDFVV